MVEPKSFKLCIDLAAWYTSQDASSVTWGDLADYIAEELSAYMTVERYTYSGDSSSNDYPTILLPNKDNTGVQGSLAIYIDQYASEIINPRTDFHIFLLNMDPPTYNRHWGTYPYERLYYNKGTDSWSSLGTYYDYSFSSGVQYGQLWFLIDVDWYSYNDDNFYSVGACLFGGYSNFTTDDFHLLPTAFVTSARHVSSDETYPCSLTIGNASTGSYGAANVAHHIFAAITKETTTQFRYHMDPFDCNYAGKQWDTPIYVDNLTFGDHVVDMFNVIYYHSNLAVHSIYNNNTNDVLYHQSDKFIHNRLIVNGTKYACSMYDKEKMDCVLILPEDGLEHLE